MKRPTYITTVAQNVLFFKNGITDTKKLPQGSFVTPIEECYLPRHVSENKFAYYYNKTVDTFVYCHYGIVVIPKNTIREV